MPDFVEKRQSGLSRLYRANSQIIVTPVGGVTRLGHKTNADSLKRESPRQAIDFKTTHAE